jgi:hypothetical protein
LIFVQIRKGHVEARARPERASLLSKRLLLARVLHVLGAQKKMTR